MTQGAIPPPMEDKLPQEHIIFNQMLADILTYRKLGDETMQKVLWYEISRKADRIRDQLFLKPENRTPPQAP